MDTQIFTSSSPKGTESNRNWLWRDQLAAQPPWWCRGAHTGGEGFTASFQGRSFPGWSGHSSGTRGTQAHHPPGAVQDDEPRSRGYSVLTGATVLKAEPWRVTRAPPWGSGVLPVPFPGGKTHAEYDSPYLWMRFAWLADAIGTTPPWVPHSLDSCAFSVLASKLPVLPWWGTPRELGPCKCTREKSPGAC